MSEHKIPAEMLDAVTARIKNELTVELDWSAIQPIAEAALEAAGVPALITERDRLKLEIESHRRIYTRSDNDVAMVNALLDGSRQANDTLRAQIAELETSLSAIRCHTDPNGEDGTYRFDCANDACDFAFAEAERAMKSAEVSE